MNAHILNDYISQTLTEPDNYFDIFEELERYSNPGPRRFSFSIPENISIPSPKAPPPSPIETIRPKITIPEDNSLEYSSDEEIASLDTNDIQKILDFPKKDLLIFSKNDTKNYRRPPNKSIDARNIWINAKIPTIANIHTIELLLLDWAYTYAFLKIKHRKIQSIKWTLQNNIKCSATWSCFVKWIICASISR